MRLSYGIVILIVFLMISCKSDKNHFIIGESGRLVEKIFDNNQNLQYWSYLDSDSLRHGISIEFYSNGDTAKIIKYVHGKKDSIETEIYPSGSLKSLRSWKMGLPWGERIEYYDGLTDTYLTLINNDTFEVEEPLKKTYLVYNHRGEIRYTRKYNEEGSVVLEEGNGILFNKLESLEVLPNDTFTIQYYLATPDWVERKFHVNKYNSHGELLSSQSEEIDENYSAVFYKASFNEIGTYRVEGVSSFADELSGKVKMDTITTEITVGGSGV